MSPGANKKFFQSRIFLPLLLALFCLALFAYGRAYYRDYKIRSEIAKMEAEVSRLQSKKVKTLEFLDFVKSDAFAEEQARLNLNLVLPGEQIAVVEGGRQDRWPGGQNGEKVVNLKKLPNFLQWWYYFMGNKKTDN